MIRYRRFWLILAALVTLLVLLLFIPSLIERFRPEWVYSLCYKTEVRYQDRLQEAILGCDRIIIRNGGFDCGGPVDNNPILLDIRDPATIAMFCQKLVVVPRSTANDDTCLCCGGPGIDFYKGDVRIVLAALQHGQALRWRGFSRTRYFGKTMGYGDAALEPGSAKWLNRWFTDNVPEYEKLNQNPQQDDASDQRNSAVEAE